MSMHLTSLTDADLINIIKREISMFVEPVFRNPEKYKQHFIMLNNMKRNLEFPMQYIPPIAVKQYRRQDATYIKAMEKAAEIYYKIFLELVRTTMEEEITQEDICSFSDEEMADVLLLFHDGEGNEFDEELFKIQLLLIGFPDAENRVGNILALCKDEEDLAEPITENETEKNVLAANPYTIQRRNKHKKLTSAEKAAKNKAALAAKEKAKEVEEMMQEAAEKSESVNVKQQKLSDKVLQGDKQTWDECGNVPDKKGEAMKRYIGIVNIKQNFYNFTPIGVFENNTYYSYTENELDLLLHKSIKHNINFYYNPRDDEQCRFMTDKFTEGCLVLLNCEIDELDENRLSDGSLNATGYKIQAVDAWNKGKISPISDAGLYALLNQNDLINDIYIKNSTREEKGGLVEGAKVLVNIGDGFYAGPFSIKFNPQKFAHYIVMQGSFRTGYNASDCMRINIEPANDVAHWFGYSAWSYYAVKNNASQIQKDILSDKDLLEAFKSILEKTKDLDYSNLDVNGIIDKLEDKQNIFGAVIPEEIRQQRLHRIREIMSSEENLATLLSDSYDIICDLLLKHKNDEKTCSLLSELIAQRPEILDNTHGIKMLEDKVGSLQEELEQLIAQRSQVEGQIIDMRENSDKVVVSHADSDIIMTEELSAKKAQLDALMEQIGIAESVTELHAESRRLQEEVSDLENRKMHLENDTKGLGDKFVSFINGYTDKMADITFDGFMSGKMLQAAADWETKTRTEELVNKAKTVNELEASALHGSDLVAYLVDTVKMARPNYSRNAIINIFTCISQGFLTVFSGMPGCGKTSICNIIAKVLGLNNLSTNDLNMKRFISVSVERGWTSKRDFIGYYNPLTKSFEENNRQVFDALKLLDAEKKNDYHKWPFLILLDEANLSPMEYYWADFMNVCDDLSDNSSINLGNDNNLQVPETLRFLATINNDHTTETLSPRLIDRAWIITLPKTPMLQLGQTITDEQIHNITWDAIKSVFTTAGYEKIGFDRETQNVYSSLKDKLAQQDIYVSPRVDIAIQNYWTVASGLMEEDEYGTSGKIIALDYAFAQKILPKIKGSGEEFANWLNELRSYCTGKGLVHSGEIIEAIIIYGNRNMQYYEFMN